jgi:hypothetical protein
MIKFDYIIFNKNMLQMSIEYKIPRILWENLESVLLAQSKRYIGELAKRLKVSEKELIKRVLPTSDYLKVIIQDTQTESQCKAYIQHEKLTIFCRKSIAYGCEYCAFHRNKRMLVIEGTNPIQIQRLKDTNSIGPMWVNNNTLYNSNGEMVGKMKDDKIKIFVYE